MFLRAIRLKGFKSFPLQTELVFEPGIAVVIGPNGSGKSNVADAVMWVLGEQSPTSIRGSSMQDMIFAGSDGRRASGSAEVELTFDNSDGTLSLPTPEVSIGRRVRRDGEATYFINRSPCRLTDVVELMAEIGLGKEMHSIIGQGKVESLLAAKPADRRALVEEAAGLGRYKRRRERAELKLREVARNLERARDTEREVASRLAPLRRQANAAELSRTIAAELDEIGARLLAGELDDVERRASAERAVLDEATGGRALVEEQLRATAEERRADDERFARELEERERGRQRALRARYLGDRLESSVRLTTQRGALLEEVERAARAEFERLRAEVALAAGRSRDDEDDADIEAGLAAALAAAENGHGAAAQELALARRALAEVRGERDRLTAERDTALARAERLHDRARGLDEAAARAAAEAKRARGAAEARRAVFLAGAEGAEAARAAETRAEAAARAAETGLSSAGEALREGEERLRGLTAERRSLELEHEHLTAGLRDLDEVGVAVLEATDAFPGAVVLAQVVACEPGYEKALAAALAQSPGAIAVPRSLDRWSVLAALRQAGVTLVRLLVPVRRGHVATFPGAASLLEKVAVDGEGLEEFLAGVVVVDDLRAVPDDFDGLAVTREGAYYQPRGGELGLAAGVPAAVLLERRSRASELEARLAAARAGELREQPVVTRLRDEAAAAEEAWRTLEAALEKARADARRVAAERRALEDEVGGLEAAVGQAERALAAAAGEAEAARAEIAALEARDLELQSLLEGLAPGLTKAESIAAAVEESHEAALSAVTTARVEHDSYVAHRRQEDEERARALAREASARARLEELERRLRDIPGTLEASRGLAAALAAARDRATALAERLEAQAEGAEGLPARGESRRLAEREVELRQEAEALGERRAAAQVELAHLEERRAELADRLDVIAERLERASFAAPADEDEARALRARADRLVRGRDGIGPVNPLAEAECAELEERVAFLREQVRDLERSSRELQELGSELTQRIDAEFTQTMTLVAGHFEGMCAILFPGGRGRLVLVEGDDEEPGGVGIEVKPARKLGKKLGLLSGGERSLVAIAFLLALMLARPSPFYILDEIEAALDDINIGRFVSLLREYRERTQFVIITHQKRTMEAADVLYGVTMGPDGASHVVSARMAEREIEAEEARAPRTADEPTDATTAVAMIRLDDDDLDPDRDEVE